MRAGEETFTTFLKCIISGKCVYRVDQFKIESFYFLRCTDIKRNFYHMGIEKDEREEYYSKYIIYAIVFS